MSNHDNSQESEFIYEITRKVAQYEGTDPRGLDPLEESIDTDALAHLANSAPKITIGFSYHGYYVTVTGNGDISVKNGFDHILLN